MGKYIYIGQLLQQCYECNIDSGMCVFLVSRSVSWLAVLVRLLLYEFYFYLFL